MITNDTKCNSVVKRTFPEGNESVTGECAWTWFIPRHHASLHSSVDLYTTI